MIGDIELHYKGIFINFEKQSFYFYHVHINYKMSSQSCIKFFNIKVTLVRIKQLLVPNFK